MTNFRIVNTKMTRLELCKLLVLLDAHESQWAIDLRNKLSKQLDAFDDKLEQESGIRPINYR